MARSPHIPDRPRSVAEVIADPSNPLAALCRQAQSLIQLESLLHRLVSPELAAWVQVANVRGDHLVLATPAASWATRLRMQADHILSLLQASGYPHLRHIEIRVTPSSGPATHLQPRPAARNRNP